MVATVIQISLWRNNGLFTSLSLYYTYDFSRCGYHARPKAIQTGGFFSYSAVPW